jgi:hypothetical protein
MAGASLSASKAAHSLGVHITKGKDVVKHRVVSEGDETAWSTAAELLLTQIFGKDSPSLKGFRQAKPQPALRAYPNTFAAIGTRRAF